jgi:hypothetical protein
MGGCPCLFSQLIVSGLEDALVVSGTVAIHSKKHGVVEVTVSDVAVPMDTADGQNGGWLLPDDLAKVRDAAVELVTKTSKREPSGMENAIKQALIDAAVAKDAAQP